MAGPGTISALLTWKGSGDLNLEVYDAGGDPAARATSGASPESLDYAAPGAGQYTLRVIAAAGKGKYMLTVRHP